MLLPSFLAIFFIMIAPFCNVIVFGGGGNEEIRQDNSNAELFGAKDEQNQMTNLHKSLNKLAEFEEDILQEFKNYEICPSKGVDNKKEREFILLCGSVKSLEKIFANIEKKLEKVGEPIQPFFVTIRHKLSWFFNSSKLTSKPNWKESDNKVGEERD
jgi:hypothetical protein